MARVFICRAHSRREPGYSVPNAPTMNEWYLSEEFCRGATDALIESDHDVETMGATLGIRVACMRSFKRKHPDEKAVAVEMHCNQMPGNALQRGFFCLAWYKSEEAIRLSRSIIRELRELRPLAKCRGINKVSHSRRWVGTGMEYEDDPLAFLESVPYPSVILEAGYLSNPIDASWLVERGNRYTLGLSVGKGILNYLEEK